MYVFILGHYSVGGGTAPVRTWILNLQIANQGGHLYSRQQWKKGCVTGATQLRNVMVAGYSTQKDGVAVAFRGENFLPLST